MGKPKRKCDRAVDFERQSPEARVINFVANRGNAVSASEIRALHMSFQRLDQAIARCIQMGWIEQVGKYPNVYRSRIR